MLRMGIVQSTVDITTAGVLTIQPIDSNGNLAEESITAAQCSPNIGNGQGLFATPPGPGSVVLFADVGDSSHALAKYLNTSDTPFKFVWLGAISTQTEQRMGQSGIAGDKNDSDDANNTQVDPYDRPPEEAGSLVDMGTPEAGNVYADNFLPQQDVWKNTCGHKFVMSHKITDKGRHDNSMLMKNSSGKAIRIDDGPPEMKMDRIEITDEHRNRFIIKTGGDKPDSSELNTIRDQEFTSEKGNQLMCVMGGSQGRMERANHGKGDVEDHANQGNHLITAEKNVTQISHNGDMIRRADTGDIYTTASQGEIDITAAGSIEITSGASITLKVGSSTIEIVDGNITITAATIDFA
jgi:hypothetical protein